LGFVLADQAKAVDAETSFREALAHRPDFVWAQLGLAESLLKQGKPQAAEAAATDNLLLESVAASPALSLLGRALSDQRKSSDLLRRVISARPMNFTLGFGLAYHDGHWLDAPRLARMASTRGYVPLVQAGRTFRAPSTGINAAQTLEQQGRYREAEKMYRAEIKNSPNNSAPYNRLVWVLLQQRRYEDAEESAHEAVGLDPNNATSHLYLGYVYRFRAGLTKAEASFREAVRLRPVYGVARGNLAYVLERLGKHEEALSEAREATRLEPKLASVHGRLSWVLKRQGKTTEADAAFQDALRLTPEDSVGARGNLCGAFGRFQAGAESFAKASRAYPENTYVAMMWALCSLNSGDQATYESVCRDMLNRFGQSPDPMATERTAKICLLSPRPVGDLAELVRLTNHSVTVGTNHRYYFYFCFARGLAAYRAGDIEETLRWCRQSRSVNNKTDAPFAPLNAYSLVVEAMSLRRQDKPAEAKSAYDEAAEIIRAEFADAPDDLGSRWEGWVIYELFRREAMELLSIDSEKP
jgi:tetratricopeptide (TPR) repeat protein